MPKVRISKANLWKAIRKQCLACSGGLTEEIRFCTSRTCSLYLFRFGRPIGNGDVSYLGNGQYGKGDCKPSDTPYNEG